MTTVPQPYDYLIADLPGAQFTGEASDHLLYLIQSQLPTGQNPVVSSDAINVTVSFDVDLTTEEKATLDALVPRCNDFYIITSDGGVTDLGNPALVEKTAGQLSSTTITLQYKDGDGNDFGGFGEEILLRAPLMTINKLEGNFDGNGRFQFIIGAELSRGEAQITIESDALPERVLIARWL